eukprot:492365-Prorocentrum_lima.AAC.1
MEASIPNDKEMKRMEKRTIEVNCMLQRLKEEVDQLEKNVCDSLSTQADRPPAPATPQAPTTPPVQ